MMKPIRDEIEVQRIASVFSEMMSKVDGEEYEFDHTWVVSKGWKIVPLPSMARIPQSDIPTLASALNSAGFRQCFAVFNEPGYIHSLPPVIPGDPPDGMATCYSLSIDMEGLIELNKQLGLFRFIVTEESRTWCISCNEHYNLFAGPQALLESMMSRSLKSAREEFFELAALLDSGDTGDSLTMRGEYYAQL